MENYRANNIPIQTHTNMMTNTKLNNIEEQKKTNLRGISVDINWVSEGE